MDLAFSRDPWQFGDGEEVEVEVLVDGAESGRVATELGGDAVVEDRDDGAVVVRLSVTDPEALVLWVLDLLDHAEVLTPVAVRDAVIDRLESIAASRPGGVAASMTAVVDTAVRLRRLLAILAWLAQVGEAPIDEVADTIRSLPEALVTELEMAACCGVPPYSPDQLMEIVVTDTTVSTQVGTALARPRRLSPSRGIRPRRLGPRPPGRAGQ